MTDWSGSPIVMGGEGRLDYCPKIEDIFDLEVESRKSRNQTSTSYSNSPNDLILVKINCFHPGMFKNEEDGKLNYVNGFLEQLEVDGDADILEKKDLVENREENKRKMNANGRSYRELDAEQHAVYGDEIVEQQALDDDEIDVEQQDDTYNGDQEVEKSEDEYQDTNEFDNEDDIDKKIEEDLSMFRNENYEDKIPDKDVIYRH
ncbi:hypothetical protein YC2023_098509 [Brassica napus]